jgi:hypothetical protein
VARLVDIVLPMGLKPFSSFSPSPSSSIEVSGISLIVGYEAESVLLLAEHIRGQLSQAPVSKHFLASAIVSEFGVCRCDGFLGGKVSGWPYLQSLLHFLFLYFQN